MGCVGQCGLVETTASTKAIAFDTSLVFPTDFPFAFASAFGGGVAKISLTGEPLWTADLPLDLLAGIAATEDAVYVDFLSTSIPAGEGGTQSFGDESFELWGDRDHFVAKIDSATGKGQWILHLGGQGTERSFGELEADANGDLYVFGSTTSHPA